MSGKLLWPGKWDLMSQSMVTLVCGMVRRGQWT